jgi:hypothetical protein
MNIAFDLRSWKNGKTMEGDSVWGQNSNLIFGHIWNAN